MNQLAPGTFGDSGDGLVSIGDFSRMTHLSIKTLRHYHDVGLLVPAQIDPVSGYRRYAAAQARSAQVIKRLRELGMPVPQVREVLAAPDVSARNAALSAHLLRKEAELRQAQQTVDSLRSLLDPQRPPVEISYQRSPAGPALAISDRLDRAELAEWLPDALAELHATLNALGGRRAGPDGSLFAGDLFTTARGELTAFVPLSEAAQSGRSHGRAELIELAATEYAVALHPGSHADLDITYSALGAAVNERAIGVDGPIREDFLVSAFDVPDVTQHRTAVGWPVFQLADR